jgi:hypothetical protein
VYPQTDYNKLEGLSTDTITCNFLIENVYLNCLKLTEQPNFVYVLIQLPKRSPLLTRMLLRFTVRCFFLCTNMILLTEMQIYRNPNGRIQLFGKLNLITLKEHFGVLPTGTSYSMNCPQMCPSFGFYSERPSCKPPIN